LPKGVPRIFVGVRDYHLEYMVVVVASGGGKPFGHTVIGDIHFLKYLMEDLEFMCPEVGAAKIFSGPVFGLGGRVFILLVAGQIFHNMFSKKVSKNTICLYFMKFYFSS